MAKQAEREEQADFPIHPNTYYTDRYLAGRYQTSRQAPWQWAKNGIFPKPVKLSPQCSRWYGQAVLDYEAKLAEAQV
jgi:predicted DNA-binding transcriptional regulator AlpA